MRAKLLLLTLAVLPLRLFAQANSAPTPDQLKQWINDSDRHSQLIADGALPFHIIATYEAYTQGKPTETLAIDETWKDPHSWKRIMTFRGSTFTEVHNGTDAWATSGRFAAPAYMTLADKALFYPFVQSVLTNSRLTFESDYKNIANLDCIGTEPKLPGVGDDIKLAEITYCLAKGNHLLRVIDLPGDDRINFNEVVPFANKYIARSIELLVHDQPVGRVHVDKLEAATDFSGIDTTAPADAQHFAARRQDDVPSMAIMYGQALDTSWLDAYRRAGTLYHGVVGVKVHIDTAGIVQSAVAVNPPNDLIGADAARIAKQWRYRVSYQGDKLVEVDEMIGVVFPGK